MKKSLPSLSLQVVAIREYTRSGHIEVAPPGVHIEEAILPNQSDYIVVTLRHVSNQGIDSVTGRSAAENMWNTFGVVASKEEAGDIKVGDIIAMSFDV